MSENFFSNRELFEMIEELKNDITGVSLEMKETRALIKQYNGLREKIISTETRLNTLLWVVGVGIPAMLALVMYFKN